MSNSIYDIITTRMYLKVFRILVIVFLIPYTLLAQQKSDIPSGLKRFVASVSASKIGEAVAEIDFKRLSKDLYYGRVRWNLSASVQQNAVEVTVIPAFQPNFHWAPHLTPTDNHIIPQHVFRAPALIVADNSYTFSLIPDLDLIKKNSLPWMMDLNARDNRLMLGLGKSKITDHVLYEREIGMTIPSGEMVIGFYLLVSDKAAAIHNPFHRTINFMWTQWGEPLYKVGEPLHQKSMEPYVKHTYEWAFKNWRDAVWQEFDLNGKRVGAPVFIVNTTQSPNYPGQVNEREFRSIWNQAWFNSLRSAQGLYRYALRTHNDTLKKYALMTKELALAFPQTNGLFKSVIAVEMEQVEIDGKKVNRSKSWDTRYFGNSNRNPYTWDARLSPYHIADMSFTAYWMLVWYNELEQDHRLLSYAKNYADALIQLQDAEGFFPAWMNLETLQPMEHLQQSPETSVSVTFLSAMYKATGDVRYLQAAERAMKAVITKIIPQGQWEDFETYWSCSRVGSDKWVGKKVARNNMFKQNTFCIYWTAEALLELYKLTRKREYLRWGQRTLDELLMAQAIWQPPFIAIRSLGGFGVMNADAEWNDSRQSLFAGLIIEYGKVLKNKQYIQRGLAALRASFTMMYTPLNPSTMKQWQARWPFFGEKDYGFMMENYGHDGVTNDAGLGIGEFTIYDWGNGAAAEAYNRLVDKYGRRFVEEN
ncbi:hypothetical protein [Niabella digestorum]|uniref:Alpha-L-rhamnosidase six-hairpin glycosidase domain-containing protein n=1 Tax=Niabella digestorum TaxID=3117701 RepID=A0ABU7RJF1_9BACT